MSPQNSLYLRQSSFFPINSIGKKIILSPPRGKPQYCPLEELTTWLTDLTNETLIAFLTIVYKTLKLKLTLGTRLPANIQRESGLFLSTYEISPEIYWFHSWVNFLCFGRLACGLRFGHVYSEEWSCNLNLLCFYFRGDIESLCLVEGRGAWVRCFGSGMTCFN